ncbi:beta-L-arabinofuranosidase domain-containing protein [Saccharicrinis sp. FJH62]|uniref:beta-L-arabinofuranosidase domain-containing protein n=1 Tax=Saccharicrinis sp. FJH62 TaxID=3344657 RepID=UPI0035D512E3
MKKTIFYAFVVLLGLQTANAQTNYTNSITNPSFESGNANGWNWIGASGYTWVGVNNDGDDTKTGTYIAGTWNASIGDVELSQTITGLPEGMYTITGDLMGSSNASTSRLTTQRIFANGVSQLFGSENDYSTDNLSVLGRAETYSFGGYTETQNDRGPFLTLTVTAPVTDGNLVLGVRTNGRATQQGYAFPNLTSGDGHGWFKVDNFTLTYIGELTEEVKTNASLLNIKVTDGQFEPDFNPDSLAYTVTLPAGATLVNPELVPAVPGVAVSGNEAVDITSGTGVSVITITSVGGSESKIYTLNYTVENPFEITGEQQDKLYTNEFPLGDVTLLDGPFKHAEDLNIQTLLKYDVDRLLAPYRKEAGLSAKASSYPNWIGLDGHIGGHYLTAMAINYAATGNSTCKQRMDYMVDELKSCQDANAIKYPAWGVGYAGGVPSSNSVWSTFKTGNFSNYTSAWVPWYNLHKTYAGLRDAWLYGNNETAKEVFLKFCDWAISITSGLSDAQMETMLNTEHGGMNEVLADAYQMTGEAKYITAAKRFSHKQILNSMAAHVDNLDNKHANTQVPKAVGFQRIAELTKDVAYTNAGQFFWQTVTQNRSLALGGNSRKEYFPQASACIDYINDVEGPESCNTNNMLKLTEDLFRVDPQAKYADFYERAMLNHILSTQHPEHGGYVYFTPARPQHYRVYSAPNQAMWCCVGTGMENHGKYGEFIYTHDDESLYLNLFIASELNWKEKGLTLRQETSFPDEEQTVLIISTTTPTDFILKVRSPGWVNAGALKIIVNHDTLDVQSVPQTYIPVQRTWSDGDTVKILLPMHNAIEQLPNVSRYVAIMHGPVLLGAKTGTQDLAGLVADDSRWGHIASGSLMPLDQAPVLVADRDSITAKIVPVQGEPLHFKANDLFPDAEDTDLVLEPFYKIHDARYMMYWLALNKDQYQSVLDSLAEIEKAELELDARTVDQVAPGEQQPEADHNLQSSNSTTGNWQNEFWRDANNGGFISYTFSTQGKSDLSLMVRYWGNETYGSRTFEILIDDVKLTTENLIGKWNVDEFKNVEYPIPNSMTEGKEQITVKFQAINLSNIAGGLFYVRILQPSEEAAISYEVVDNMGWKADVVDKSIRITALPENGTVAIYDIRGKLIDKRTIRDSYEEFECQEAGVKIIRVCSDGKAQAGKVVIY